MSTLRNKVQLIGNVGNEPKITHLESGSKLARFSMATNEYYRNAQGEKTQSTQWHNVVVWDKRAEIIEQYVRKGKEIAIEGKLISRSYTNEMGVKSYVTEIVATEILLLGAKLGDTPLAEIPVKTEEVHNPENMVAEPDANRTSKEVAPAEKKPQRTKAKRTSKSDQEAV